MPWLKRDELPEELKDLSPAQIAAAVKESGELKAKLAALEAENKETKSAFESANETAKATEAKMKELEQLVASKQDAPKKEGEPRELTNFLVDGDRAFAERAVPLAAAVMDTRKQIARDLAARKFGAEFQQWQQEIDALAAQMPLAALGDVGTWEHLYFNVKGRKTYAASQVSTAEGASGGNSDKGDDKKPQLTEQEKKIAKRMGIPEDVYLKNKTEMVTGVDVNA